MAMTADYTGDGCFVQTLLPSNPYTLERSHTAMNTTDVAPPGRDSFDSTISETLKSVVDAP